MRGRYRPQIRWVREHIPLEQGLRPKYETCSDSIFVIVREHIPLEQGLRLQFAAVLCSSDVHCQRAYSIRTRIKTTRTNIISASSFCQRAYSIRTRIKT